MARRDTRSYRSQGAGSSRRSFAERADVALVNLARFAGSAIVLACSDRTAAPVAGWVSFDRGLVDVAAALQHATSEAALVALGSRTATTAVSSSPRLGRKIYGVDNERRHAFADAIAEYERLCPAYTELDYDVVTLPRPRSRSALISPWRRCSRRAPAFASNVPDGCRSHGRLDHYERTAGSRHRRRQSLRSILGALLPNGFALSDGRFWRKLPFNT
ncbi:AAA family ATPase [Sphingomonas sp. R86520]|uniref:AAA family ATPase n=1 Tax=Sphingomonas sp. R86520 TaxID=3093859 RepID=UPI0036D36256